MVRSHVQHEVSAQLPKSYGLIKVPTTPLMVESNRQLVEQLLANSAFHHEVRQIVILLSEYGCH